MSEANFWKYFFEIFEAIPRQGPGDRRSTERAFAMLPPLESGQRILDIGCGSGTQTLDLARATGAQITAVDFHPPFIAQLEGRLAESDLGARVAAQVGDMNDLPFEDGSFDVVWCEGAIFIIGFAKGLAAWRRLLPPGGYMVVSEFCWFRDDPPAELREMFIDGNTDDDDVEHRRRDIEQSGYRLLGDFALPHEVWWDSYYEPLGAQLERFRAAHAGDADALAVAARSQREIELYQRYPGAFGYMFFVMQRPPVGTE